MRDYELLMVVSPEVGEDRMPEVLERLQKSVVDRGGEITNTNPWGRRRLAYPIKRFLEGQYVLTNLKMDPIRANEVEATLRLSEDVLRHMMIRLGD
ncbi:MAG: 30S ribosomal protein S6 [Chloroflexi bacterium]|nr:30S ribosomal protein S6 [Chloroflexota bacterium]